MKEDSTQSTKVVIIRVYGHPFDSVSLQSFTKVSTSLTVPQLGPRVSDNRSEA